MVMWPAVLVGQTPIPSQMMTSTSFWNITLSQMPGTNFLEMLLAGVAFSISGLLTISLGLSAAKRRMKAFVSHVCSLRQATEARIRGSPCLATPDQLQKALEQIDGHRKKERHSTAITRANEFQRIQEDKKLDLSNSVNISAVIDVFAPPPSKALEVVNILEDEESEETSGYFLTTKDKQLTFTCCRTGKKLKRHW